MEQPTQASVINIVIQWAPTKGQFGVQWPEVDDVIRLGMLQMALNVLSEARIKNGIGAEQRLIVPANRIPS
jgi:hypothetical protein